MTAHGDRVRTGLEQARANGVRIGRPPGAESVRKSGRAPSLSGRGFELLSKLEVASTRPALDRADWRCEGCRDGDDLRVFASKGHAVVLCALCRTAPDEFRRVLSLRTKQKERNP